MIEEQFQCLKISFLSSVLRNRPFDVDQDACNLLKKIRAYVSVVSNNLSKKRSKSKSGKAIIESISDPRI
jgi:hypothetical protein